MTAMLEDLEACDCGGRYLGTEGWAGRCPACAALIAEHAAGLHTAEVADCRDCQ
jgi:hypothetical protein